MTVGDPRPARRIADRNAGVAKLLREGACRACGRKGIPHLSRAHLVGKGVRGDDVDENIVPLCGSGTTGCHGALHDHHRASYPSLFDGQPWEMVASALRARLTAEERAYVIEKKGEWWLNTIYPW